MPRPSDFAAALCGVRPTTAAAYGQDIGMSDDTRNTGSPDRDRINLHEDDEVRDWTQALGVSADELRAAVQAVGSSAASRAHLRT
ncbi:hypothetical protein NB712_001793 [Xanthomonas sacchari]|nr:hypothetical protein [Xanthomonas sacchari]